MVETNKELILDCGLTPTMERIRSGSIQLFREKDSTNRSFISHTNCDILIEHDNPEMYAALIDNQWYWVSGCAECNGKERDWSTYIECDKHNKCSVCSISRKDTTGDVWGGKSGWTCNNCKQAEQAKRRAEAFLKLDGEEPDTLYLDEIVCPHCGTEMTDSSIHESQGMECSVCEGEFKVEVDWTASYCTEVKGERITK